MRRHSSLIRVCLLLSLTIALCLAQPQQDQNSLAETLAESRIVRSPEPGNGGSGGSGGNGGNGGKKKKRGKKKKKKRVLKKGKKAKKEKKPEKDKDKKKKKKRKKNLVNKSKTKPSSRSHIQPRSATVSDSCFESAMFYMKIWKDVVGNFEKQRKRMIKQNKTGGNKSGKKGLFAPIAHRLVDIGGGNKSNMSCGGQYGNKGAGQLQNLTKTLFDCEKDVNASCNPANIPQPNFTFINLCKDLVDNFTTEAGMCLGKTMGANKTNNEDACSCWTGMNLNATAGELKNCKVSDETKAITTALKACTATFGKCRKFEDGAITAISSCASSSSKLTAKAANLAANNASMTAAKEKMNSLASSRRREKRTASSCSEVITISQRIVKITNQNPQSTKITFYAKKISTATVTCTTEEKESMKAEVTSMESAIASVSTVLTAIQEQIETLTGSTASTSQLATTASSETTTGGDTTTGGSSTPMTTTPMATTMAPSGRRDRIRQQLRINF